MRSIGRALVLIIGAGAVAAGGAGWYAWQALHTPVVPPAGGVAVAIPAGAGFRAVAERLQRAGVLRHPRLLTLWARYRGEDRRVHSGEYRLEHPLSPVELLALLQSPANALRWVTLPEGLTAAQVGEVLEREGFGGRDVWRCAMSDPHLLADLELPASGVEGYLFPDTYAFEWAMEPPVVVRRMVARFREESARLTARRVAAGLSEAEMITLASVIEKETAQPSERSLISGVFHNRLRLGMPLQSDPTVLYAVGMPKRPLTRADLAHPSPYNTYAHGGLPPGPIANPGRAALEAAVAPAETRALYFVARNDGTHEFSASLEDHNRAVRRYQR